MPSAMPSQSQANKHTPRKPSYKIRRKLTTLSFEQLDRAGTTIFTEDISSSSRIRRPSYVLRQGEVVGANMPDTIKLSKHRSKIYVGLSDTTSFPSSRRESRGTARSEATSSAATTIGKASIIDWTDAVSDVSGNVPLSGELSIILPPVPGAQTVTSQPPPGLDTSDIFSYRAVHHKRWGTDKSPRPPASRGGAKFITGFRPPQNTPFLNPNRADDFASSLRKKIVQRPTFEHCNVVVCGGGIALMPGTSRENRQKSFFARENTLLSDHSKRKTRRGSASSTNNNNNNQSGMGVASFDLPVIDLKCVESPVADLGDLEEKGIRLVKLRNTKKKRHISQSSDPEKNGSVNGETIAEESKEVVDKDIQKPLSRLSLTPREEEMNYQEVTTARINTSPRQSKRKSITTSSTGSDPGRKDSGNGIEEIGINREPYSTPLLPNLDTNRTDTSLKYRSSPRIDINYSPGYTFDTNAGKKELVGTDNNQNTQLTKDEDGAQNLIVLVENVDPSPINPPSGSPTPNSISSPRQDSYTGDTEDKADARRFRHRTSSLLSVPASIISEHRPPSPSPRENPEQDNGTVFEDADREADDGSTIKLEVPVSKEHDGISPDGSSGNETERRGSTNKTVATQTHQKTVEETQ